MLLVALISIASVGSLNDMEGTASVKSELLDVCAGAASTGLRSAPYSRSCWL
jgi:hypothetical protein